MELLVVPVLQTAGLVGASSTPPVPWWDRVTFSNTLIVVSLFVALVIYLVQSRTSIRQQRQSTLAHLSGVHAGMKAWADDFFGTSYAGTLAEDRSELDFNTILETGDYFLNFRVPTEPVASLIQPPGDSWPVNSATIQAANIALLRMTMFNQLVQQRTDLHVQHSAELMRTVRDDPVRLSIAQAAKKISETLHGDVIGDRTWYLDLMDALNVNITELDSMLRPRFFWINSEEPGEDLTAPFRSNPGCR